MAVKLKGSAWESTDNAVGYNFAMGTSASPDSNGTAGHKFVQLYTKSTATSGDNRSIYNRYDIDGAGASGESLRSFTDLGAAAATARGAHISLQAGATGYVTGLGAGVDSQLYFKNEVLASNGTYAGLNVELYSEGSTTAVSGATSLSFARFVLGGDTTGAGRVEDKVNLITITGGSNASGNVVGAQGNEPTWSSNTYLIRCNINGVSMGLVAVGL